MYLICTCNVTHFQCLIIRNVPVQSTKHCMLPLFVPASWATNQLQFRHLWLVYKCTSPSAKDGLDNSGQVQLEAVLRLMYVSTPTHWHVHLGVSQYHITHFAVQPLVGLAKDTVTNLCSFRAPGEPFLCFMCNLSLSKQCCRNRSPRCCYGS